MTLCGVIDAQVDVDLSHHHLARVDPHSHREARAPEMSVALCDRRAEERHDWALASGPGSAPGAPSESLARRRVSGL
jgi:hypothetical protein